MSANDRADLTRSLCGMKSIELRHFETDMEALLSNAAAVVAMGGYNTFCEILSFNKPALIIPRTSPRREQAIRATRAAELGLVDMLGMSDLANTERFAAAIRDLPDRRPPFDSRHGLFLDGLENIAARVAEIAADRALVDEVQVRLPQPAVRQERALAEV